VAAATSRRRNIQDSQQKAASPWWGDRLGAEIHGDRTP
jgi:hypothetical protein